VTLSQKRHVRSHPLRTHGLCRMRTHKPRPSHKYGVRGLKRMLASWRRTPCLRYTTRSGRSASGRACLRSCVGLRVLVAGKVGTAHGRAGPCARNRRIMGFPVRSEGGRHACAGPSRSHDKISEYSNNARVGWLIPCTLQTLAASFPFLTVTVAHPPASPSGSRTWFVGSTMFATVLIESKQSLDHHRH